MNGSARVVTPQKVPKREKGKPRAPPSAYIRTAQKKLRQKAAVVTNARTADDKLPRRGHLATHSQPATTTANPKCAPLGTKLRRKDAMSKFVHRRKTTSILLASFALIASGCGPADVIYPEYPDGGTDSTARADGGDDIKQVLAISPSMVDFGFIALGDASAHVTFTVKNVGNGTTGPLGIAVGGADMVHFAFAPGETCEPGTTVLKGGESCTVGVLFAPSSSGVKSALLTVSADPGGLATSTLTGNGTGPAVLEVTPPEEDFGTIAIGDKSLPVSFTVTNPGATPTGLLDLELVGIDVEEFALAGGTCVAGSTILAAGSSCTVLVEFAPTSLGTKLVLLSVSATPGGIATSTLTGNGAGSAELTVRPETKDFGAIAIGDSSLPVSFTVTNPGAKTGPLDIALTGADAAQFALAPGGTCVDGSTILADGSSCTVLVEFAPTTLGAKSVSLTVSASPGGTATAALTGNGTGPATLTVTPETKDFGTIPIGDGSLPFSFTVTNSGAKTGPLDIALAGADAAQFALTPSGTCVDGSTILENGASCTVLVEFAPTSLGAKSASLTVSASPGGTAAATLTGNGTGPAILTVSPGSKNFGTVAVGGTSATASFTVTNTGSTATGPLDMTITGADAAHFAFAAGGTCFSGATVLVGGASCKVNVRFVPTADGAKSASLALSATPGGSATATLTGTGSLVTSVLVIAPTSMNYGSIPAGSLSARRSFVVANTGSAASGALQMAFGGADAADFLATEDGTCVFGSLGLLAGAACTVDVRFRPSTVGAKSATLIVSATPGGVATATLTGTALPAITQLATGYQHTCVTNGTSDRGGMAWCWGNNSYGQLGNPTLADHTAPTPVPGLDNVAEIAVGVWHTCARDTDGSVRCWGANGRGQLGDGSTTNHSMPTLVPGLGDVAELALSAGHSCARRIDGSVLCWGLNAGGELGDGSTTNHSAPAFVPGLSDVEEITAGGEDSSYYNYWGYTCARKTDGTALCWGYDGYGQLGVDPAHNTSLSTPTVLPDLADVVGIAARWRHTCALTSDSSLFCWGSNANGQLGLGETTDRGAPVRVPVFGVGHVALGYSSTCVQITDGTVRCWGANDIGQLGDGTNMGRSSPTPVPALAGLSAIVLGGSHGCALSPDLGVVCWGNNAQGELGDGSIANRLTPVDVIWP